MKRQLLNRFPLHALRHLEAAIRLGTFEMAARELNVTPSAVSQQIKRIEDTLGQALFERSGNRVKPNARAVELGQSLSEALALLEAGLQQALGETEAQSVKIRLYQTWANRWLVPRLEGLTRQLPGIAVEFETSADPLDFSRTDADLALATHTVTARAQGGEPVIAPRLLPFCAPGMAERLREPGALAQVALVASRNRMTDWSRWLQAVGMPQIDQRPLLVFSNSTLVYESALSGAGVAVAQLELVLGDLESGRLVAPFALPVLTDLPILLFDHPSRARNASVRKFRAWIIAEMASASARADRWLKRPR